MKDKATYKEYPLTLQETFDLAYNGVVNQGSPCLSDEQMCVYIGENGKRCAAGHIFDKIEPKYDLKGVDNSGGSSAIKLLTDMGYSSPWSRGKDGFEFVEFICALQKIHDLTFVECPSTPEDKEYIQHYKASMVKLAGIHNLAVPDVAGA